MKEVITLVLNLLLIVIGIYILEVDKSKFGKRCGGTTLTCGCLSLVMMIIYCIMKYGI